MPRPLGLKQSATTRARIAARRQAFLENPYERARISDTMRTTCADPDRREAMSAAATHAWQDPEKAARMGPPRAHLAALTPRQRADYRLLQNRGFTPAEILDAIDQRAG